MKKTDFFLQPLSLNSGAGEMLVYHPIYNEIMEARREDDQTLSQGIWKVKPKTADWQKVENLTSHILEQKSKDLRVLGWLIEAWIMMNGLNSLLYSISLLQQFCEKFWPILYPNAYSIFEEMKPEKDDNDSLFIPSDIPSDEDLSLQVAEHRFALLEWIDATLAQRLYTLPILQRESNTQHLFISIADWIQYQNEYQHKKRNGQDENLEHDFVKSLTRIDIKAIYLLQELVFQNENALDTLEKSLLSFDLNKSITFKNINNFFHHIKSLIHFYLKKKDLLPQEKKTLNNIPHQASSADLPISSQTSEYSSTPQIVSNRDDAYVALHQIKDFLNSIDPHSPSLMLLDLAIQWQNKSFVEIIEDIQNGSTNTHNLLRLFNKN